MSKELIRFFKFTSSIRSFFNKHGFVDAIVPIMVENPGCEPHIHPFEVFSKKNLITTNKYLHTSPEFAMKQLICRGLENIFNISICFRDEPKSSTHNNQFVMLEWYRTNQKYEEIMKDCKLLINYLIGKKEIFIKKTIKEIFYEILNINILDYLEKDKIINLIKTRYPELLPSSNNLILWDDYYFLIFLNKIEPNLKEYPYLLLYEFPYQLRSFSTIKPDNPKICQRFELYINGIEVANCFNEITDIAQYKKIIDNYNKLKNDIYNYQLPPPNYFYKSIEKNSLPNCSGIALGIERLYASLNKLDSFFIEDYFKIR